MLRLATGRARGRLVVLADAIRDLSGSFDTLRQFGDQSHALGSSRIEDGLLLNRAGRDVVALGLRELRFRQKEHVLRAWQTCPSFAASNGINRPGVVSRTRQSQQRLEPSLSRCVFRPRLTEDLFCLLTNCRGLLEIIAWGVVVLVGAVIEFGLVVCVWQILKTAPFSRLSAAERHE